MSFLVALYFMLTATASEIALEPATVYTTTSTEIVYEISDGNLFAYSTSTPYAKGDEVLAILNTKGTANRTDDITIFVTRR